MGFQRKREYTICVAKTKVLVSFMITAKLVWALFSYMQIVGFLMRRLIILCSRFADKFSKHMKWFLLILFILGGGCFLVFALYLVHIVPDLKGKKQLSF